MCACHHCCALVRVWRVSPRLIVGQGRPGARGGPGGFRPLRFQSSAFLRWSLHSCENRKAAPSTNTGGTGEGGGPVADQQSSLSVALARSIALALSPRDPPGRLETCLLPVRLHFFQLCFEADAPFYVRLPVLGQSCRCRTRGGPDGFNSRLWLIARLCFILWS